MARPPLSKAVTKVLYMLRMHSKRICRDRVIRCNGVPLTSSAELDGVNLCSAFMPGVPATAVEAQNLFDIWLYPLVDGEGDPESALAEAAPLLTEFVMLGSDFAEQTVRLMAALGSTPGAHLKWGDSYIRVHHSTGETYGIVEGATNSRFCSGVEISADYDRILTETPMVRIPSVDFASLYLEAKRKGKGLDKALIAMWMWQPYLSWPHLSRVSLPKDPTKKQLDTWIQVLAEDADPVGKLYKRLVPKWLTPTQFTRVLCGMAVRQSNPSMRVRQGYINRLSEFFHDRQIK